MKKDSQLNRRPLKEALLERIERERVCPYSALFFRGKECLIWFWWALSVLVGALAVAVTEFVLVYRSYSLFEVTHGHWWFFLVEVWPYVWLVVFGTMTFLAYYNLRQTRRGYRYSLVLIIGSSLILSVLGGSLLHYLGFGHLIDQKLGQHSTLYDSQDKLEHRYWQEPALGRLLGVQIYTTLEPNQKIILADVDGLHWVVDVSELSAFDLALLATTDKVRLLGIQGDQANKRFKACWVLPWVMQPGVTADDLRQVKREFKQRLQAKRESSEEGIDVTSFDNISNPNQLGEVGTEKVERGSDCTRLAEAKQWSAGNESR